MVDVVLIAMGGTIASRQGRGGATPQLTAEQLVEGVPGLTDVATIHAETFRNLPSIAISFDDVVDLARLVEKRLADGADGVVIAQGTDTLEEVAFALDLLVRTDKPVVITGAMRHADLAGPDGPANLLGAVQVAAAGGARGLGTLVVMNDLIHAARFVQKCHTSNPAAFQSPLLGPVGYLSEGEPFLGFQLPRLPHLTVVGPVASRVLLITVAMDDAGMWIDLAASGDIDGCVVEGLGGGHVPSNLADRVVEVAAAKPVVLTSRTGAGRTLARTYGVVGGEMDLLSRGLIHAGSLDGPKSRVLLTLLLAAKAGTDDIRDVFRLSS